MPSEPQDEQPLLGDRYRILRQLGEGGMGTVHEAIQVGLGRRVAVKLLHPGRVVSDRQRARFRREAETTAQLLHPNLVQVTDFGIDGDRPFMVMEYLEGENLRSYLRREGRLPPARAVAIAAAVLAALRPVHRAGVVHRDIKPGNIFIVWDDDGQPIPKLLDFGIASDRYHADSEPETDERSGERERPAGETARLTQTDSVFGTVAYMAPEQVRSAKLAGPPADQYAVGVVLYECLSGRLPHEGDSAPAISLAKLRHDPPDLHELCPEVPESLCKVVMRALAFEPSARYADVSALRAALVGTPSAPDTSVARGSRDVAPTTLPTDGPGSDAPSGPRPAAGPPTATTAQLGPPPEAASEAETDGPSPPRPPVEGHAPVDSATHDTGDTEAPNDTRRWLLGGLSVALVALMATAAGWVLRTETPTQRSAPPSGREPEKAGLATPLKAPETIPSIGSNEAEAPVERDAAIERPASPEPPQRTEPRRPRRARPRPPARRAQREALNATGYDNWTAAVHVDAAGAAIDRCVAQSAPPAGNTVRVQLRIDDDGAARSCRADGTVGELGGCICRTLRGLNWSAPPGGGASIEARYRLE